MNPDPEAPVPFADDPQNDPVLHELFGAARRDRPPVDAPRIAARAMAPRVPLSGVVGVAVLLLVGAAALLSRVLSAEPAPAPPLSAREVAAPVVAPARVEVPAAAPSVEPEARLPEPSALSSETREVRPRPVARAEAPSTLDEGAILLRARRALATGDHAAALAAVAEHEGRFARGPLSPEREAIAIDALAGAGRGEEARARAERFLARWPDSAYAARARRALERP